MYRLTVCIDANLEAWCNFFDYAMDYPSELDKETEEFFLRNNIEFDSEEEATVFILKWS